jgi:ferredoxin-fold anticodon binding domain-containing protein
MLRYIGPFFKMNKLTPEQIDSQLFHLSKESIKNIVMFSNFGIIADASKLTHNIPSTNDINTTNKFSPLLCVYKKASLKLKNKNDITVWNENKFKKDINISSNAYMTLCILELLDYYKNFKKVDKSKFNYYKFYTKLAKEQLEFYAAYLRNEEGVFVDKKDCTDPITEKIKLKDKETPFSFSNQALLMNAYYKCSLYLENEEQEEFKDFAYDIFKMFKNYKDELYELPMQDLNKLCLFLSLFYETSMDEEAKILALDIFDCFVENHIPDDSLKFTSIENLSIIYFTAQLLYAHTKLFNLKKLSDKIFFILKKYYDPDYSMLYKSTENKEIKYNASELLLYFAIMFSRNTTNDTEFEDDELIKLYQNHIINSGIISKWPDVPSLGDIERYRHFEENSTNLLEEQFFKVHDSLENNTSDFTPGFLKAVYYNRSKNEFKQKKTDFDSRENFNLFFLIIYCYNRNLFFQK